MKKRISIIFVIIGLIGITYIKTNIFFDYNKHIKIINNELIGSNKYEGYIEIDKLKIKRLIIEGDYSNLDKGFVVMKKDLNTILYGHAIEQVFLSLYNISIGDEIKLFINNEDIYYKVEDIYIVNKDEYDFSKYVDKLILVTCLIKDERLVVIAKKNDISHF